MRGLAALPDGGVLTGSAGNGAVSSFVATWVDGSATGEDTDGYAVRGRIFDVVLDDRVVTGPEFLVNTTIDGNQGLNSATELDNGGFVVTWEDWKDTGSPYDYAIRGRIFDANGQPSGDDFPISTIPESLTYQPNVTALEGGGFVVTWWNLPQSDLSHGSVLFQVFDDAGARVGNEFQIDGSPGTAQLHPPRVAGLEGGGFVVTWLSDATLGAQIFDNTGGLLNAFVVSANLETIYWSGVTGLANGGFVVTWDERGAGQDLVGHSTDDLIRYQIFDHTGAPVGSEFTVNKTTDEQGISSVTGLADGGFIITWTGDTISGVDWNVLGQIFDANGQPVDGQFQANNTTTTNDQNYSEVAALGDGQFVVTWQDRSETVNDTSGAAVRGQVFDYQRLAPTISDADDAYLESATVAITSGFAAGEDVLGFDAQNGITGNYNPDTGTLTLTGHATLSEYDAAFQSVTYENTSNDPSTTPRTVAFMVNDGEAYSNSVTREIIVTPVDDGRIDLASLTASQGFVIEGNADFDRAGWSVSSAGDVNGDGAYDLIVGAPYGNDGGTRAGEAYVVFGPGVGFGMDVNGRPVIDLTTLGADQGFIIQGDEQDDAAGWSVSGAGDVNGDGFDDLIVGSQDGGFTFGGKAYVVFGSGALFGTDVNGRQVIDLTTLNPSEGFVIQGDSDQAGESVSSAGDVDSDGFDDLIVGAKLFDGGSTSGHKAYVVFGSGADLGSDLAGRQVLDLATLDASQGFLIQGDTIDEFAGWSVSSAGDVNGDGFSDLIVGALLPYNYDTSTYDGEVYVVFGTDAGFGTAVGGRQVIDFAFLTASEGFVIRDDTNANTLVGRGVSSAGDVNGDGFDDLLVGAINDSDGVSSEAYVVFGTDTGFGITDTNGRQVIDVASLDAGQGFVIQGDATFDGLGGSVSSAGDVNGDSFDDLIVGAPYADGIGVNSGITYVVFGTNAGFGTSVDGRQVIDVTTLGENERLTIEGDAAGHRAGSSVSSAGDINQDGFDDLIVGAPVGAVGEAYVVYGGAFGSDTTPISTAGTAAADILIGGAGNDTLTGGGGGDVIRSGAGDDVLGVSDGTFARIDGGTGTDTLRLDGSGITLDLTGISNETITGIEAIDLTGTGNNGLTLTVADVYKLSETPNANFVEANSHNNLVISGDAGDTVTLEVPQFDEPSAGGAWADVGQTTIDTQIFDVKDYVKEGDVLASVAIDHDITII